MSASLFTKGLYGIGLTLWVVFSLVMGEALAALPSGIFHTALNQAVLTTIIAALGYAFALGIALGVPALVSRRIVSRQVLGIDDLPSWSDIGLGVLSVLPYYIASGVFLWLGINAFHIINPQVGQEEVFSHLSSNIEYLVAFATLVVMAPFAEELLFRGYFLGRLSKRISTWAAIIITAATFALMHVPGFTDKGDFVLQWGAAADTFALGLVAGSLRMITGRIWAGMLLHALKNAVAFYFLFIATLPPGGM